MKHAFLISLAFLALSTFAMASLMGPIQTYFFRAENVYLVKVTSFKDHKVTFSITEVLRGKTVSLTDLDAELGYDFKVGSEWMLVSIGYGGQKNRVGSRIEGYNDWLPAAITHADAKVSIEGLGSLDQAR